MNREWTVLLIGGSSGTGKSILARSLALRYKIPLTEVDDIRIALQAAIESTSRPNLFTFLNTHNYLEKYSPKQFVKKLVDVGKEVWKPLNTLIDKHIACNEPVIFEGDGIIPDLLVQRDQNKIEAVFLYDDIDNLTARTTQRNRGGNNPELIAKEAKLSYALGQELKRQAEANGYKTLSASPSDTLLDRFIKAIE